MRLADSSVFVRLAFTVHLGALSVVFEEEHNSGNPILDEAALQTLARVSPFPNAPTALAQGDYDSRIPVTYRAG